MSIFTKIFGDANEKQVKQLQPIVQKIGSFEAELQKSTPEQLKGKTVEFKERLAKGETLDDLLPEAFAAVREAARRTLNQRHFDVQLIGGMVLHQGKVAEMRTGEGKTLTATLAVYLNALEGKGVHVVTVNEYLAKRDMVWMGQIYAALGMTAGCVTATGYVYDADYTSEQADEKRDELGSFKVVEKYLKPVPKKEAYATDITYGTNNEFGFDYLRDNMVTDLNQQVQRGHHYVIVDEVDSVLIDEARVPLIISGPAEDASEKYYQFAKVVSHLEKDADYTVDEKLKAVSFTEEGQEKIVKVIGSDPWQENDIPTTHQLESALKAKALFLRDRDYVVQNNEIMIIDEFTGRMLPGRRWSAGLHQAIEAKENVKIQPESVTLATVTFQNYFRLYKKISGMTGTALTSAEELDKVYELDVVVIPTHRQIARQDFPDKIFKTEEGKFKAVIRQIKELHEKGQPVLVGTRSVERNEYLAKLLKIEGIPHEVLNAKNHEREGEIIAQAGKMGAVVIATNMAGRGVDIILGGNPPNPEDAKKIRELGGLYVLGTERHDARRIDNQLRGRAGRQGDPGASQFFVSLEDDLMRIFGGDRIKSVMNMLNVADDEPIQAKMISNALESAQEKIEGFNFDARHHVLEYDDVMTKHREIIYKKRREILEGKPFEIAQYEKHGLTQEAFDKRKAEVGEEGMVQVIKFLSLRVIDTLWQEHLTNMEHMRESVRLRAYGGKDPLIEYKNEGRNLFARLLEDIDANIAHNLTSVNVQVHAPQPPPRYIPPMQGQEEVGRNDFCPCGSGKKYKKCGMLNTLEHQQNMAKK
jgi:preprotein translocase subunit SecA